MGLGVTTSRSTQPTGPHVRPPRRGTAPPPPQRHLVYVQGGAQVNKLGATLGSKFSPTCQCVKGIVVPSFQIRFQDDLNIWLTGDPASVLLTAHF